MGKHCNDSQLTEVHRILMERERLMRFGLIGITSTIQNSVPVPVGNRCNVALWPRGSITVRSMSLLLTLLGLLLFAVDSRAEREETIRSASELDYPPFALVTPEGEADGFAVDLLKAATGAMGRKVSFRVGPWHEIKQDLAEGKLDVLPLVARTAERTRIYDFSIPYLSMHGAMVVRKGDRRIANTSDLADKRVMVMQGDIAEEYVKQRNLSKQLITSISLEEGLQRLATGEGDAMVVQALAARKLIRKLELDLDIVGDPLPNYQDFCFAVRSGDKEMLALLNEGLSLVTADGTLQRLREHWLGPVLGEAMLPWRQIIATIVISLLVAGAVFLLWQRVLVMQVGRRTAQLGDANRRLAEEIAERKSVEADLRKHREQLEALVEKRTAALQEADRHKDEFLAMLGHELRNPLAPIRNAIEVVSLWPAVGEDRLHWACDLIQRQVSHLTRLVDDLLDMSRISRGLIELQPQPLDLCQSVAQAADLAMPQIEAKQHRLTTELPKQALWVNADPVRITQAVGNLLNNAAKYTDPGGQIELELRAHDGEALICVSDNGIGIDGDLLPHVFELFTQGERSLDRSQGGMGLGLTLVKRLVEMHGGQVTARSRGVGRGSVFCIALPLLADTPTARIAEPRSPGPISCKPCRILVVDDNLDAAESLRMLLEALGHQVETAPDGPTALAGLGHFGPEVVLLDLGLPHMDGFEIARRIRARFPKGELLLVAVTGYGQDEDYRRSLTAGFDHHLTKPTNLADLQAVLCMQQ